jgi:hypothetical protein
MPATDMLAMPAHVLSTVLKPVGIKKSWTHLLPQYPNSDNILGPITQKKIARKEIFKKRCQTIATNILNGF